MKAITIYQPWASLIALGAKRIETRSWKTNYRGTLAIHAAKSDHPDTKFWFAGGYCHEKEVGDFMETMYGVFDDEETLCLDELPHGYIVATAWLCECLPIDAKLVVNPQEKLFGDFRLGRWAWILHNIRRLEKPIPVKGRQGLWEWQGDVAD